MKVAICALTHLRPQGLDRLLTELAGLRVPDDVEVEVYIIDNDPAESARTRVEEGATDYRFTLTYATEPTRGISAPRNKAVAVSKHADFMAFIDDDEWPEPDWLFEMLNTKDLTGADVVTGPVLPIFDETPPAWVERGGFFERPRFPHNSMLEWATTSTVLISRAALDAVDGPFDLAFGVSGGEDTLYFDILHDKGFRIAWSDTAIVSEAIPASRVSSGWILRREYRRGQTLSRSLRARGGPLPRLAKRAARGGLEIATGIATLPLRLLRDGRAGAVRGAHQVMFGAGILTGLADRHYDEYLDGHHGT